MKYVRRLLVAGLSGLLLLSGFGLVTSARMRVRERAARDVLATLHRGSSASEVRAALRSAGVPFEETRSPGSTGFGVSSVSWLNLFMEERDLGMNVDDHFGLAYAIEDRIFLFDEVGAVSITIPPVVAPLPVFGEEKHP